MQKNLGYVIPNIVIPDATTAIGYWYLGSTPLGFRATGTMWTIGADHYWYCDNIKTQYLAEIPVEDYNEQFANMITEYGNQWTTYFDARKSDWTTYFTDRQNEFSIWFNQIKDQLSQDAAGHLQNEINEINHKIEVDYFKLRATRTVFVDDTHIEEYIQDKYKRITVFEDNKITESLYDIVGNPNKLLVTKITEFRGTEILETIIEEE